MATVESPSAKQQMIEILTAQPDDSTFDELLHELYLARVIRRGLDDVAAGRVVDHDDVRQRVKSWFN